MKPRNLFRLLLVSGLALLGVVLIVSAASAEPSTPNAPLMSIPTNIPAQPGSVVSVPVNYTSDGTPISSIVFAIDYDQTWLMFDPTVPQSITLSIPNGFVGGCTPNTSDPFAELNCFIYDPAPPLEALPSGTFVTFKLRTGTPLVDTVAPVNFSTTNPTSFGNTSGQAVVGSTSDGSVLIDVTGGPEPPTGTKQIFLPMLAKQVLVPPTETCNNFHLQNLTFEPNNGYWFFPATVKTAWYTNFRYHSASWSAYTGIDPYLQPNLNMYSYSSVRSNSDYTFTIPANATKARLRFYQYPLTTEWLSRAEDGKMMVGETDQHPLPAMPETGKTLEEAFSPISTDVQYLLVLDSFNYILASPIWELNDARTWLYREVALLKWKGVPIKLEWGTANDGWGGVSAQYIDDVYLEVCTP